MPHHNFIPSSLHIFFLFPLPGLNFFISACQKPYPSFKTIYNWLSLNLVQILLPSGTLFPNPGPSRECPGLPRTRAREDEHSCVDGEPGLDFSSYQPRTGTKCGAWAPQAQWDQRVAGGVNQVHNSPGVARRAGRARARSPPTGIPGRALRVGAEPRANTGCGLQPARERACAACARAVGGRAQHVQGQDGGGGGGGFRKRDSPRGGRNRWGDSGLAARSPNECAWGTSLEAASGASKGLGEGGPRRDASGTGSHLHSGTSSGAICGDHCKRCLLLRSAGKKENSSEERLGLCCFGTDVSMAEISQVFLYLMFQIMQ
ncbi:DNA polymerase epsilon subunit 4 isoform X1 [Cebus imitator]|uniref:DNA polymerase epsilon subunit 4 isoform X1 n=1 Tax=Cebus imitator TaxID=2715852 RepID=UPI00080A1545|nr:DNA polymerase epsilon subunit 4 isoform X1 [Cebus imitator]XP_017364262.1 DNA polymerase epsilon subunit 4 isoform X1 [Cebus imitator]